MAFGAKRRRIGAMRPAVRRTSYYSKPSVAGVKPRITASQLYPYNQRTVIQRDYFRSPYAMREDFELHGAMHFAPTGTTGGLFGTICKVFLNDIWVPFANGAVTSSPPYGYAQIAERYQRYKVTRCIISAKFYNASGTTTVCIMMLQDSEDTYTFGSENVLKTRQKPGAQVIMGCQMPTTSPSASSNMIEKIVDKTP